MKNTKYCAWNKKSFRPKNVGIDSITVYFTDNDNHYSMYYDDVVKKWKLPTEIPSNNDWWNTTCNLSFNSIRAVKRHMKKHPEIPVGATVYVFSKWMGCDWKFIQKEWH